MVRISIRCELPEKQRAPAFAGALLELIGRLPTLPHTRACSTIGAERLNYRVRDGNGWDPLARITQKCFELLEEASNTDGIKPQFIE